MRNDALTFRRLGSEAMRWPSRSLRHIRRFGRAPEGETPDTPANVRTAAVAMAVAFALFALFASDGMRHFTRDLPGNVANDFMVESADRWHALMERVGPAKVQPAVRAVFERIRDVRW